MMDELEERGYKVAQLSRDVNKTPRTVWNWRYGYTEPSYTQACIFLRAYRSIVGSTERKYISENP
jgi:hypothetical protein